VEGKSPLGIRQDLKGGRTLKSNFARRRSQGNGGEKGSKKKKALKKRGKRYFCLSLILGATP